MISLGAMGWPAIVATLILLAGVVDDLRSRKFHNWLFLVCSGLALLVAVGVGGIPGLMAAVLGFAAGIGVLLPFVLAKMIGAGDMKLMAAFGILTGWNGVLSVAIAAFVWGAIFGLVQVIVSGQLMNTLRNMIDIAAMKDRQQLTLHKIPFTVALFMGWLTYLVRAGTL